MKEHYSFSALKGINWNELSRRFRHAAQSAKTVEDFSAVIGEMLAELEDLHVWIELPGGKTVHPYASRYRANFNYEAVTAELEEMERFGRLGFTGRTKERFGVLVVDGLPSGSDTLYERLVDSIKRKFDAPGFIVDLRSNGGGSEPRARQIAGLFADREYVYARSKVRSGAKIDDFREAPPRQIEPALSEPYTRPVICLIGPGCVSSGEGFALMMKAMDHVTLVGQPTRGASGNPLAVTLSNGVKVWFSRWVSMVPDGTLIEGRGVGPDVSLAHEGAGDSTFEKAVAILRDKAGIPSAGAK